MPIVRDSRAAIYAAQYDPKCPQEKSWLVDSIRRAGDSWRIVLSIWNGISTETILESLNSRQLTSFDIVRDVLYIRRRIWLTGHTRSSWRAMVAATLRKQVAR